ncbi:MAG: hypothetical protein HFE35_05410 [Clostridia bacterium]|jgi:hypothetical protein|uniref:hypothetical protein n=1 Tax=Pumilibacter muris TaxID=2941510 RepID=UPI00203D1898|nr:hypothetical protein [Pumilibacter muris]MCI8596235.1 hypothetical protein [Clostridia bacterium]
MKSMECVREKEKLVYKKCCNYACECGSDCLRKLLGDAANESRMRLGISSDELKND